jgi:hypothetical protein
MEPLSVARVPVLQAEPVAAHIVFDIEGMIGNFDKARSNELLDPPVFRSEGPMINRSGQRVPVWGRVHRADKKAARRQVGGDVPDQHRHAFGRDVLKDLPRGHQIERHGSALTVLDRKRVGEVARQKMVRTIVPFGKAEHPGYVRPFNANGEAAIFQERPHQAAAGAAEVEQTDFRAGWEEPTYFHVEAAVLRAVVNGAARPLVVIGVDGNRRRGADAEKRRRAEPLPIGHLPRDILQPLETGAPAPARKQAIESLEEIKKWLRGQRTFCAKEGNLHLAVEPV